MFGSRRSRVSILTGAGLTQHVMNRFQDQAEDSVRSSVPDARVIPHRYAELCVSLLTSVRQYCLPLLTWA